MTYLDTQSVLWLFAGETSRFSSRVNQLLQSEELVISPMVKLELHYLHESGKIRQTPASILKELNSGFGLSEDRTDFAAVFDLATTETWTRDPFDRIIASHARKNDAVLITSDRRILKNYGRAIW